VFAHAHDAAENSPILAWESPEKRCGKTTALGVIAQLVPVALPAANITTAAVFRSIEKYKPTLVLDEVETFIRDNEEMRGVLNSGFTRRRHSSSARLETNTIRPRFRHGAPRSSP
jgi:putative DNA primase/helicase